MDRIEADKLYVRTPRVNATTRHLPIELELTDRSRADTNFTFEYRNDPVFTNITPTSHLTAYDSVLAIYRLN